MPLARCLRTLTEFELRLRVRRSGCLAATRTSATNPSGSRSFHHMCCEYQKLYSMRVKGVEAGGGRGDALGLRWLQCVGSVQVVWRVWGLLIDITHAMQFNQ
jgi:hypothetical protein